MNRAETVFNNPSYGDNGVGKVNNFTGADLTTNTYYCKTGQTIDATSAAIGDHVYIVHQGEGQCVLNNGSEEAINVAPGSIVYIPSGVDFRMTNTGMEDMVCTEVYHPSQY